MKTATNAIVKLLGDGFAKCDSPSLRLEKFVSITPDNKDERKPELDSVVKCYKAKSCSPHPFSPPRGTSQFEAYLLSNLIVNQSGGVLENAGLCLDRLHGSPYIPGSALKGVASHAAYQEWLEQEEEQKPELAKRIASVFGFPTGHLKLDQALREALGYDRNTAIAGQVSFLAATPNPKAKPELVLDIATPHHPDYYQGKRPLATDDEAPIPLAFPVVKAGAEFLFRLVPLRNASDVTLEDAKHWLLQALTRWGVGAKTAAGMGWFALGRPPEALKKEKEAKDLYDLQHRKETEKEEKEKKEKKEREEQAAKYAKELEEKKQAIVANAEKPFSTLAEKGWKKVKDEIQKMFNDSARQFSSARQNELFDFLKSNPRVSSKDLNGAKPNLIRWLGEELTQKLLQEKDAK